MHAISTTDCTQCADHNDDSKLIVGQKNSNVGDNNDFGLTLVLPQNVIQDAIQQERKQSSVSKQHPQPKQNPRY